MKAPYLLCMECKYPLKQLRYPIDMRDKWTMVCPKCGSDEHNDIEIGGSFEQMRTNGTPEDTVLFIVPERDEKGVVVNG